MNIRVKICGITQVEQGLAIAELGASALGFICVTHSPRYIPPDQIRVITACLPALTPQGTPLARIGVFANASGDLICQTVEIAQLTGVQLHGHESPEFCQQLSLTLPQIEIIKALRIKTADSFSQVQIYQQVVPTLLLDAYTPNALGGTGEVWDWSLLQKIQLDCPWLLAGGITPDTIHQALSQVHPPGIDLSSGVERAPGDKDLDKVRQLFRTLETLEISPS